jgi:hypothetical protein
MLGEDQQFALVLIGWVKLDCLATVDAGHDGRDTEPATRQQLPPRSGVSQHRRGNPHDVALRAISVNRSRVKALIEPAQPGAGLPRVLHPPKLLPRTVPATSRAHRPTLSDPPPP